MLRNDACCVDHSDVGHGGDLSAKNSADGNARPEGLLSVVRHIR